MPSNLTDSSSFDPVSAPVGSDIRNAASIRAPLQTLANRTRYVLDQALTLLAQSTPLADFATLKAIASPANGTIRTVKSYGRFVFDSSGPSTEVLPLIVRPTVGSGSWIHELYLTRGASNGLASLSAAGKLVEPVPNRIVDAQLIEPTSTCLAVTSTTFADSLLTLTFSGCQVGDLLLVDASLRVSISGTSTGTVDLKIVDGGTNNFNKATLDISGASGTLSNMGFAWMWTVLNAGSVTVTIRGKSNGTDTLTIAGNATVTLPRSHMRILRIRP